MDPPRSTSKNVRLLVKVLPWSPSDTASSSPPSPSQKILPFLLPCPGDRSIQDLAELIQQKFSRIHTGKGDLHIRYLQDAQGGLLDTDLQINDVFYDDKDHTLEDRTVLVVQFPPTEDDLRNPFRCASLVPESSAVPDSLLRPRKRRLEDNTGNSLYRENSLNASNREKRQRLGHNDLSRSVDRDQPIISREDLGNPSSPGRYPPNKDQYNSYAESRPFVGHQPLGDQQSYQKSARTGFNPYGTPASSSIFSIDRASHQPDPLSIPDSPQHVQAGQEQREERAQSEPLSPKSESPELTTSINNPRPPTAMYMTSQNERESGHQEIPGSPLHLDEVEGVLSTLPEESVQNLKPSENMVANSQPAMENPERRATTSSKPLERNIDVDTLQTSRRLSPETRQDHRPRPASPKAKVINGVRQRDQSVVRPHAVGREPESGSDADEASVGQDTSSRSEFVQDLLKNPERRASDRVAGRPELQVNYALRWTPLGISDEEDPVAKSLKKPKNSQKIAVERWSSEGVHKNNKEGSKKKRSKDTDPSQPQKGQASTVGHLAEAESARPGKSRDPPSSSSEQWQGEKRQRKVYATSKQPTDADNKQHLGKINENGKASHSENLLPGIEVDDLQSEPWVQAMLKDSDRQTETRKNQKAMQKKLLRNTNSNAGSTEPSEAPESILKHPKKEHLDGPYEQTAKAKANGTDQRSVKRKSQALSREPGSALHEPKQTNSTSSRKQSSESEASNASTKKPKGMGQDPSVAAKVRTLQLTSSRMSPKESADEDRVLPASTPKKRSTTPLYPSSSVQKPSALKYQSTHSSGSPHGPSTSSRYLAPSSAIRSSQASKRRSVSWPDDIEVREVERRENTSSKASVEGTSSKEVASKYHDQSEYTSKHKKAPQIPASTVQSPSTRNAQTTTLSDAAMELSSDSEKSMSPFISGDEEEGSRRPSESKENSNEMFSREGTSDSSKKGSESSRNTLRDIVAPKTGTLQVSRGSRSPAKFIAGDIGQESSTGSERTTSSVTESSTEKETDSTAEGHPPHADQPLRDSDPRADSDEQLTSSVGNQVMETPHQLDKHRSLNHAKLDRRSEHSDVEANEQLLRESQASMPQSSQDHSKPALQMSHSGALQTMIPTSDLPNRSTPVSGRSQDNVTPSRFASFANLRNKRKETASTLVTNKDMGKEKSPINLDASETSGSETSGETSDGEPAQSSSRSGKRRNPNASMKSLLEMARTPKK